MMGVDVAAQARIEKALVALRKAEELLGNDTDNLGAVLDAWVLVSDAIRALDGGR